MKRYLEVRWKIVHLVLSVLTKLQSNFTEMKLRHGCSPVNLLHILEHLFLRTPLNGYFWRAWFYLSFLNVFSNSWKESSLCTIEALHWGKYSFTSLVTYWNLACKGSAYTNEIFVKLFFLFFFFGDSLLSVYSF